MINIAIFASGEGTNARQITAYFKHSPKKLGTITLIVCSSMKAGVVNVGRELGVKVVIPDGKTLLNGEKLLRMLKAEHIDFVVLAGYLKLMPKEVVDAYEGRMVNLHPSLLPRHGGKGMYGMKVHQQVMEDGDRESGITIHYVSSQYDSGRMIAQYRCPVLKHDTLETLTAKVHALEYLYYPPTIEKLIATLES
ncbi:MAG: phosphoribosylglycinamide formyltransferase [Bacteroidaceae bacterium]|nr:phosphoribosylglycinamide formyltransferase [Bacteroidaceae bacterium]